MATVQLKSLMFPPKTKQKLVQIPWNCKLILESLVALFWGVCVCFFFFIWGRSVVPKKIRLWSGNKHLEKCVVFNYSSASIGKGNCSSPLL